MQDKQTGAMAYIGDCTQEEYDKAIPDRKRQGVVLTVGEEVDVKGGTFRVKSIGKKMIVLEGIPGTRCEVG